MENQSTKRQVKVLGLWMLGVFRVGRQVWPRLRRVRLAFCGLCLLLPLSGWAQGVLPLDSLQQVLAGGEISPRQRVDILNRIAQSYDEYDSAFTAQHTEKAIRLSRQIGYLSGQARAYLYIGQATSTKYDYPKAEELFEVALVLADSARDASLQADVLTRLADTHYFRAHYPAALELYQRAYALYQAQKQAKPLTTAAHHIGNVYYLMGNNAAAKSYYEQELHLADSLGDLDSKAKALTGLGILAYMQGEFSRSLDYHLQALQINETESYTHGLANSYENIAMIYSEQGKPHKAMNYLLKASELQLQLNNKNALIYTYFNLGSEHLRLGQFDSALANFRKLQMLGQELGNQMAIADSYRGMAYAYDSLGQYDQAISTVQNALPLYQRIGDQLEEAEVLSLLGQFHFRKGDLRQAKTNLLKAKELAIAIEAPGALGRVTLTLSKVNAKQGDYAQAYENFQVFADMKNRMYNQEQTRKMATLEAEYAFGQERDSLRFAQEKERLAFEKEAEVQQANLRQRNVLLIIAAGILAASLLVAVVFYRQRVAQEKANVLITEQKEEISQQAEELQSINEKLRSLDEFKQVMTGTIVHDLKNPLNAIIHAPPEQPDASLRKTRQIGRQMLNMVLNILDVHKYEDTQMTVDTRPEDLYTIATKALGEVSFLAKEKNQSLNHQIPTDLALMADEEVLTRVFANLLTNAIKYTPIGGEISLGLSEQTDDQVTIFVRDTGVGIPADALGAVFEKFQQVAARDSGKVRSTGLGLTFCKMAVEAHGGTISVESQENVGTTFYFTLATSSVAVKTAPILASEAEKQVENLSDQDQAYLSGFAMQLAEIMVYELTSVQRILHNIEAKSQGISHWKKEMQACMETLNQDRYLQLIKQADGSH